MGHSSCQDSAPLWALHELISSFRAHSPTAVWNPQAAVRIFAPPSSSMDCRGITCFVMMSIGCRRISALAPGALAPHHSSLTLVYAGLSLFSRFFPHSSVCSVLPALQYAFPMVPPSWLLGSPVPCSGSFRTSWNGLCLAQGSPWPHPSLHIYTCMHIFLL